MSTQAKVESILNEAYMNMPEGVKIPTIKLKLYRNSNCAGRAKGIHGMEINADLAEQHPEQLRDTVLHELAHLMVHLNHDHRCKPHGREWQDMMYLLGVSPEVCHRMHQPDVPVIPHNTHHYRCACRDHYLKSGRHNKHICYGVQYRCRECGTDLEYIT